MGTTGTTKGDRSFLLTDLYAVLGTTIAIWLVYATMWYTRELQEPDSYTEAFGMLMGAVNGLKANSPGHYAQWIGFGYPRLLYLFGDLTDLTQRDNVVALMNWVGHVTSFFIFPSLWGILYICHGKMTSWVGSLLFCLSPVLLEIATSAHQIIPSLSLFLAAFFLLLRFCASRNAIFAISAIILLFLALIIRFEVVFAFPWVVLSVQNTSDWKIIARDLVIKTAFCVCAIALFFIARHFLVGQTGTQQAAFVGNFYKLSMIPRGLVAAILAAGIASVVVAAAALAFIGYRLVKLPQDRVALVLEVLAPLALTIWTWLLWALNPLPARHFLFFVLGCAIIIGIAFRLLARSTLLPGIVVSLLLCVVNQGLAEAVVPLIRRVSPARLKERLPLNPTVSVGNAWHRRAVRGKTVSQETTLGDHIATLTCLPRLVVLSNQGPQLAMSQYHWVHPTSAAFDGYKGVSRLRLNWPGRSVDYIFRPHGEESDLASSVLSDPSYADVPIIVDQHSRVPSDITEPPAARLAPAECGPETSKPPAVTK